ncbi:putative permease [Silvibacterium bohemicum]|uniref:Putative permease n=1 Tax=Silvibacterium bohemicum TaxID=1577686 RepID=A0A841JV91_9BACT|nr:ABC transporter permease [Silvibacterium bohemicum]MBB6145070.1 putative permease [Silvibacterium bohemicum]
MLDDLKFALRQLRKSPGFTLTAVLTLALGIGANTSIFSLLDQALLRALPVREPQQLVLLENTGKAWNGRTSNNGGDEGAYFSYPMYKDLRDQNRVFDGLIAMLQTEAGVVWHERSDLVEAELVSGNYFDVLGVKPAAGRLLVQADDVSKNGNPVVVLSFDYWKNHLGEDSRVIGQTIAVNGHPFQILGVASPGFDSAIWGSPADIFVPMTMKPIVTPNWDDLDNHRSRWLNILGRLKSGETREQAQVAIAPLWHSLRAAELLSMGSTSKRFVDGFVTNSHLLVNDGSRGFSYSRDSLRTPLLVVMGMVVLVVLMAAVNVASLVLVRSASRLREFSMRYSLGAPRGRVIRQLLIEGLLLGVLGGVVGLILVPIATRILVSRMTSGAGQPPFSTSVDDRVLAFNFAVALGVSLLFALAPALQLWKPDLVGQMKQQSAASTGGSLTFRRITVGLQIGLSLLLLVCSGLFVRTLKNLHNVDVGFATDHLITFGVNPNLSGYPANALLPLHKNIREQLAGIPGVVSVAATDDPELADNGEGSNISIQGYTAREDEDTHVEVPIVTPGYFATLKVPMLAGREFNETDDAAHPKVVVINEALAKRFFGTPQQALGRMLGSGGGNGVKYDLQIVGVARNYIHRGMKDQVKETMYSPFAQDTPLSGTSYYLRTYQSPEMAIGEVRRTLARIDTKLVADNLATMDEKIEENISDDRMIGLLAVSFGALATLLAGIGLYGVLAYATAQRTREIGVRMALGADRAGIVKLVLRDVLKLAGISIAVTIPLALLATRLLKSQLFNVSNADPMVFLLAMSLIAVVAVVAASLPARRAANIEPMKALRSE